MTAGPVAPRRTDGAETNPAREFQPGVLLAVAWVGLATVLQVARQPGVPSWDHIWAEDGGIFLSHAFAKPFLTTVGDPHAGYLQVMPRIVASFASALPVQWAALGVAAGSAVVVSCLSLYVYFASGSLLRSQWARALLAGLAVLLPATAFETNASAANLHWYLIFACFWVFVVRSESWPAVAAGSAVVLAATLSDPLSGLLLPLALVHAANRKTWRGRVVLLAFLLGLAGQLLFGVLPEPPSAFFNADLSSVPEIYGLRVAGSFLVGDRYLAFLWEKFGVAFPFTSLALVVLIAGYGIARGNARARLYIVVSLVYSFLFFGVTLKIRGTEGFLDKPFSLNGSRYTVVPILFLVVVTLLVLDRREPRLSEARWRDIQYAFVLFTLTLVLLNFSNLSVRSPAPSWRAGLAAARDECAAGPRGVPPGQPADPLRPVVVMREGRALVVVPIAPGDWPVVVSCERVQRDLSSHASRISFSKGVRPRRTLVVSPRPSCARRRASGRRSSAPPQTG